MKRIGNKLRTRARRRVSAEALEPRLLLSQTLSFDTTFGTGGYAQGYAVRGVRADGSIVAKADGGSLALLHPDGTFASSYRGPLPQPPPQNVQSDGKYLVLNNPNPPENFLRSYATTLVRRLANGSVDPTFGTDGVVSDFITGTSAQYFYVSYLMVRGTQIYVAGVVDYQYNGATWASAGIEHILPNGKIDFSFGYDGIAQEFAPPYPVYSRGYVHVEQAMIGPNGDLYLSYNANDDATLLQFDSSGHWIQSCEIGGTADHEVDGMAFEPDGKLLVLATSGDGWDVLRFNAGKLPAELGSGEQAVYVTLPLGGGTPEDYQFSGPQATMFLRADGTVLVTGTFYDIANFPPLPGGSTETFTFAVNPGLEAGMASASGRIYNDINSNATLNAKEPGLPWWQVYADLNNNGIFDPGEPTAFANRAGEYTLTNLPPGKYVIREVRQDPWTRTQPAGTWPGGYYSVTLSGNQQRMGLNFGNAIADHRTGRISGVVYNDYNGDLRQDNGEKGLAGWQVYADTNDNGIYDAGEPIAITNGAGQFTLTGLQQGGYRVREVRKDGWVRMQPFGKWPLGYYDVALLAAQNASDYTFGNAVGNSPEGTIEGVEYNDANGNGKLDSGEKRLANASVFLSSVTLNSADHYLDLETTTASDGSFSFKNLPPGVYELDSGGAPIQHGTWITTGGPSKYVIALRPSEDYRASFLMYNQPLGNITFYVNTTSSDAGQVALVYIDANDNAKLDPGEQSISNEAQGNFGQLPPGTYVVRMVTSAGWAQTSPANGAPIIVTLGANQTAQIFFSVQKG